MSNSLLDTRECGWVEVAGKKKNSRADSKVFFFFFKSFEREKVIHVT